jgi:hypothetical protein
MTQPTCPFCGAAWSDAMVASFDAMRHPSGCACCADPEPVPRTWRAVALEDIVCASCNKTLYAKPPTQGG